MNLARTSLKFDTSLFVNVFDAYEEFYGQIRPFSESVRSGPATKRRILSVSNDVVIPTRRIATTGGVNYMIADPSYDWHKGEAIRAKYPVLPVTTQAVIQTVLEVVDSVAGVTDVYMVPHHIGVVTTELEKYGRTLSLQLYFSRYETIALGSIVSFGSDVYRVTAESKVDGAGFGMAEAVNIEQDAIGDIDISVHEGTDLVTETPIVTPYSDVASLNMMSQLSYDFASGDQKDIEPGDMTYWFSKTVVPLEPKPGSVVNGRTAVAYKEKPTGVWEVRTRE